MIINPWTECQDEVLRRSAETVRQGRLKRAEFEEDVVKRLRGKRSFEGVLHRQCKLNLHRWKDGPFFASLSYLRVINRPTEPYHMVSTNEEIWQRLVLTFAMHPTTNLVQLAFSFRQAVLDLDPESVI